MPGLLLAAMLAAAAQAAAPAAQAYENVVFARGHLVGWSMKATNVIDGGTSGPAINRMLCEIEREGLQVTTWRHGDIAFAFQARTISGRMEHGLRFSRVRRLVIDGAAYEVEARALGALTDRYTDVAYPESQIIYPPSDMFFAAIAVRREGSELWLGMNNLANELLEARQLRIGFGGTEAGPLRWIEVPLAGLAGALGWCQAAMTSPNALRLRPR